MTRRNRDHDGLLVGLAWTSPWIVGFLLFTLVPLAASLRLAFTEYPLLEPPLPVGLANLRELIADPVFRNGARTTLLYALASVGIGTPLALGLALLLNERLPGAAIARSIVFLPTLLPLVTAAFAWMWMLNGESGLVNRLLADVGIQGPNWLGDPRFAPIAIVVVSLWNVGGAMLINLAALRDVPRSLLEAAALDGAGAAKRLRHVVLPMISHALLFNAVIGAIWALQVFAVPWIMTQGGPGDATRYYTLYLYENAFVYLRMGYASAMAWIQLAVILLATLLVLGLGRRVVFERVR